MSTAELVVVILAAVLAALVKSTVGMGYPLVLLPALVLFMDVADAIIIVAPSNLVLNVSLMWGTRTAAPESPTLARFLWASVAGGAAGALVLTVIPDTALRLLLVGMIVAFLVGRGRSAAWTLGRSRALALAPLLGLIAGLFQGATGVSGPVVSAWFLSQRLVRNAFIVSITAAFTFSGLAQIVVLAVRGEFTRELLAVGLLLVPVAMLLTPIGVRLRERLSVARFESAVVMLLALSALSIVARMF